MKKKKHQTEDIIRKADGEQTAEEVCREENICVQTFYRWRRKYGRMEMADAKRFKELVNKNGKLKKMIANEMLKIESRRREIKHPLLSPMYTTSLRFPRPLRRKQTPSSLDLKHPVLWFYSPFIKSKFLAELMVI